MAHDHRQARRPGGVSGGGPADRELVEAIERLVAAEHELLDREAAGVATDRERAGLEVARETLDQLWDLLRQRRARRDAGLDPGADRLRDIETVERYEQ
ncbi:MAG: DUF2630 family protein [Actinomycetota bacterium]